MPAPTEILSTENDHRLEQAIMPDGSLIQVKVPLLEEPSPEVSQAGLSKWGYEQSLIGAIFSMMGGAPEHRMYSLPEAEGFMRAPEGLVNPFEVQNDKMGYIDLNYLANWIEETVGDPELAEGIRSITAQQTAYGRAMPFVKSLLQERIAAYRQCVADEAVSSN